MKLVHLKLLGRVQNILNSNVHRLECRVSNTCSHITVTHTHFREDLHVFCLKGRVIHIQSSNVQHQRKDTMENTLIRRNLTWKVGLQCALRRKNRPTSSLSVAGGCPHLSISIFPWLGLLVQLAGVQMCPHLQDAGWHRAGFAVLGRWFHWPYTKKGRKKPSDFLGQDCVLSRLQALFPKNLL